MNYQNLYYRFIEDRLAKHPSKARQKGRELHHIVPRCLGGPDYQRNLISLSYSDHLFAHFILAKIHGGPLTVAFSHMIKMRRYRGRKSRQIYHLDKFPKADELRAKMAKRAQAFLDSPKGVGHMGRMIRSRWDRPGAKAHQREKLKTQGPPMLVHKHSPETLRKMSEVRKAYYAKKQAEKAHLLPSHSTHQRF